MFDVMAVGDTTQDIFLKMSNASLQCKIHDSEDCLICFDYANKIAVDQKTDVPAVGNAANHAIGIARLALSSAIYTVVGDDTQGKISQEVFQKEGVDTRCLVFDKQRGTNFSAVINFKGERTIFVYHEPREYKLPQFEPTQWIYLTSVGKEGVARLHEQMEDYLDHNRDVKLALNPGTHQLHLGKAGLKNLLARTDILFLNREEAADLLESQTNDVKALLSGFHELGVKTMVLTDGPAGAYVSDGQKMWSMNIFKGPVIERTGAGDAYGSGFLAATIKGHDVPTAMAWGDANSTSVVAYIGAREGLLTEESIAKMIEENSDIKAEPYAG